MARDPNEVKAMTKSRISKGPTDPAKLTESIVALMGREVRTLRKKRELNGSEARALTDYLKALIALQREHRQSADEDDLENLTDEELGALKEQASALTAQGETVDE